MLVLKEADNALPKVIVFYVYFGFLQQGMLTGRLTNNFD
jgi:hypothetical protein